MATKSNAVLISDDIAEARAISDILEEMDQHIAKPIYFILGNHDYYQSSVENVRKIVTQLSQANPSVNYLPETVLVQLSKNTLMLNDSRMIQEIREGSIICKYQLLDTMQKLAYSSAATFV